MGPTTAYVDFDCSMSFFQMYHGVGFDAAFDVDVDLLSTLCLINLELFLVIFIWRLVN